MVKERCNISGNKIPRRFQKDWKVGRIVHNRFAIVKGTKKASELAKCKKGNKPAGINSQFTDGGISGRKLKRGNILVTWRE